MENNLQKYLTEEERKEMGEIICKAMERRGQSVEGKAGSMLPFEFVVVDYNWQEKEIEIETDQERIYHMLAGLCKHCREFGCCPKEDEALPFNGMEYDPEKDKRETELSISFQEGRMDALCQLIVHGIITLEEALPYAGMVEQELRELYESWMWFNSGENQEEGDD